MNKKNIKKELEILLYKSFDGGVKIDVLVKNETVWLSQKRMADVFNVDIRTINDHLQNIFNIDELNKKSVIRKFRITATDNKRYLTNFYNLDAVIAVGYRVNSKTVTQFYI